MIIKLRHIKTTLVLIIILVCGVIGLMFTLEKVHTVSSFLYQPIMETIDLSDANKILERQIRFAEVDLTPFTFKHPDQANQFLKSRVSCYYGLITLERKRAHSEKNRFHIKKSALFVAEKMAGGFYSQEELRPLYTPLYLSLSSQKYDRVKVERYLIQVLNNLYLAAGRSQPVEPVVKMDEELKKTVNSFR